MVQVTQSSSCAAPLVSSAPSAPAGPSTTVVLMGTCSSDDHWCALMANVCKLFVNQPGSIAAVGSVLQSWTRLLTRTRTSSNEIHASTVRNPRAERVRLLAKLQHDDHIHRVIFRGFEVLNKSTISKGKKDEEELKRSSSQGPQQDFHGHEHGVWTQAGGWQLSIKSSRQRTGSTCVGRQGRHVIRWRKD